MKPKSFWVYTVFGLLTLALGAGILALGRKSWREDLPAYAAHRAQVERIEAWYRDRGLHMEQMRFDEALARGIDPSELADPADRILAARLRKLADGFLPDAPANAKAISALLLDDQGRPAAFRMIDCPKDSDGHVVYEGCAFDARHVSLGNPERLSILLGGGPDAIRRILPEVPAEIRAVPQWPDGAQRYAYRWPAWTGTFGDSGRPFVLWTLVSIVFVFGFAASGALFSAFDEDEGENWQRPIASWPHFILGWIVMLAAAPGFILFKSVRLLAMDARPAWKRIVRAVARPSFKTEHERAIAMLTELREKASARGSSEETVRYIDSTLKKVREVSDHEELDKLRRVAEDIRTTYEIRNEIEQALA